MDYKNGKIYVIRNHCNDFVYVGSTTQSLSKRFSKHKRDMKNRKKYHYEIYKAVSELGIENFYIELLELYPCNSRDELRTKEGYYIRKFDSFNNGYNMRITGRTDKEYREDNKEKIKQKDKKYYQNNREIILQKIKIYDEKNKEKKREQRSKKVKCECGSIITNQCKSRHLKTMKHLKYIETTI